MAMMGTALDEKRRPTPRSEGVKVPDALEAAFRKALAVDPRDRFPDVGTFWDEVELALGLEPSFAPIARPGRPGAPPARPSAPRAVASPSAATVAAPVSDSLEIDLPVAGAAGQATVAAPERGADAGGARATAAASPAPPAARSVRPAPPGKASPESPRAAKGPQERARPTPKPPAAFEFDFGHELPPAKAPAPPALDMGAEAGRPRVKPLAAAPSSVAPPPRREGASLAPPEARSGAASELSELFGLPLRLAGAGVLLSLLDQAVASLLLGGERIGIGPLKLLWVAAGLVVVAIGIALARVLGGVR
jgi:serine/threonine-protein kinase